VIGRLGPIASNFVATLSPASLALGFDYRASPRIGSALALVCAATALFSRTLENGELISVDNGGPSAPC
jgi:hypothetical protein